MRPRFAACTALLALIVLSAGGAPAHAQFPPDSFTNLRVLPRDIAPRELVTMMAGFTRALGVRCTHCHVGEESIPLAEYDFASDERPAKRTARAMLEMVEQINTGHLAALEDRADPPVRVDCVTCHRGARHPRMLQDVLLAAWAAGGVDSAMAEYRDLRRRYHGRFTFDFSEVPLADVAGEVGRVSGRMADAERLHALNVEMNPASAFAQRSHAAAALFNAFVRGAADGRTRLDELSAAYGADVISEAFLIQLGIDLVRRDHPPAGADVLLLATERHPDSARAWAALGEAYGVAGDRPAAIRALERALELDPSNTATRERLTRLRAG